jgi:hypothetical protein
MTNSKRVHHRIGAIAVRQASMGVVAGMAAALVIKGYVSVPITSVYAAVSSSANVGQFAARMREGQYRVSMHCPVKHNRVTYHIQAARADDAQTTLQWMLPACNLSAMGQGQAAEGGRNWFAGQFTCQGGSYKRTQTLPASDLRQAAERGRIVAPGCQMEVVDQISCAALDPTCDLQFEDFKVETELGRTRLLR